MTTNDWLVTNDRGAVRRIKIDRPDRRNAVPADGWDHLREAFEAFEASDQRVLVFGAVEGAFCAGADLSADGMPSLTVVDAARRMAITGSAAAALHRVSKPTIALVDGPAVGAGMNLALGCDMVIATTRARFSEIFVRRGLSVDFGGTWLLPRIVGIQRAKELALTGREVHADEAFAIGLCLSVHEPDAAEAAVDRLVELLLQGAPIAQGLTKQMLDHAYSTTIDEALSWEGQSQALSFTTRDFREGVLAFLEKRPAEFDGT